MKDRKQITFTHPEKGTLLLTIDDVRLPKRIRDSINSVEESRFKYSDFNLVGESIDFITKPLFFEWQKIDLLYILENIDGFKAPFSFYVNKHQILESKEIGGRHHISGSFNLKNAVGYSTFYIQDSRGEEVFKLDTEIYPQKLEYKKDFQDMIYEITKIIYNLAFDYLQKTYTGTKIDNKRSASLVEWRAILEVLFEALEKSIDQILKNPKSEIESKTRIREVSRVKKTSRGIHKWMLKNQQFLNHGEGLGVNVSANVYATRLPETRKKISYNTFENRFVVWAINQILSKLDDLTKYLKGTVTKKDAKEEELKMLKDFRQRLRRRLSVKILKDVDDFENQFHFSTVLTMAPGYKDFYHKYLLLRKALSVFDDDQFKMDFKDIATLYEYWCFLKIVQILKEDPKYNLVHNDLIKVKGSKFIVSLKEGAKSEFVFEDHSTKEQYHLFFNRSFSTDTYSQRPDYSIQFKKDGYANPFWYVLDAKYRFNKDDNPEQGRSSYDAPDDAIGQLHRYRDAILHQMAVDVSYKSAIKNLGGLILYPFPNDESEFKKNNKYFKSIEKVNIGALPLAPGKDTLFKSFIDKLFSTSPESHYERFLDYDKSNYTSFLKKLETICVIGLMKEDDFEARKSFYLTKGMYNVRFIKNPNIALYKAKYIALYSPMSKEIIGYAPIKKIEIEERQTLEKKGANWGMGQEDYAVLYFEPKSWKNLSQPFKGKPLSGGYRYTNLFALEEFFATGDANTMNLNDFNAIRLWKELKSRPNLIVNIIRGKSFQTLDGLDKTPLIFKIEGFPVIKTDPGLQEKCYYFEEKEVSLEWIIEKLDEL
ncbi:MAG: DUF2357 domain-containing protein [Leptospiraceae bacterium]|nr:DUF2357 domain-containing protein [Leptospiraceae bacterium]